MACARCNKTPATVRFGNDYFCDDCYEKMIEQMHERKQRKEKGDVLPEVDEYLRDVKEVLRMEGL